MVTLIEEDFGMHKEKMVKKFTWRTTSGAEVSVISYGAIIQSMKIPDRLGVKQDLVLGYDDLDSYVTRNIHCFGATVGKCDTRIGTATFEIDGQIYNVAKNIGKDSHGVFDEFHKVVWSPMRKGSRIILTYISKDMDDSYPGNLVTTVTYEMTNDNKFLYAFKAFSNKKTEVRLTNHTFINLAGHDGGAEELYKHYVVINADKMTKTDSNSMPTGGCCAVQNTPFDFTVQKKLGDAMSLGANLFNENYCIDTLGEKFLTLAATVTHPPSGRYLEVHTDQPRVHFYTGNLLPSPPEPALVGKNGVGYRRHGAFCLRTQSYPDAVHDSDFPPPLLLPGQLYVHRGVYKFGINNSDTAELPPLIFSYKEEW